VDVHSLPALNAFLNGTSFVLLLIGYLLIRRGRRAAHQRFMLAAFGCSIVFLTSYLIYHAQVGSVRFPGTGTLRTVYLSILLTHTVLAAAVPFLATITLTRGLRGRFQRHRSIARVTLPIWMYVSITGVVIYLMLYQL
jgi:uncharacterized membrane protein YozB (DUF420 family)